MTWGVFVILCRIRYSLPAVLTRCSLVFADDLATNFVLVSESPPLPIRFVRVPDYCVTGWHSASRRNDGNGPAPVASVFFSTGNAGIYSDLHLPLRAPGTIFENTRTDSGAEVVWSSLDRCIELSID